MTAKYITFLMTFCLLLTGRLFAQVEEPMPPPDQSFLQTLIMIAIAFMFFYVILWRPEQKRKKALEQQRNAMKKGDRVAFMGIIGTVARIEEHTVIVKMYDGASKLEVYKAAITDILTDPEESKENKKTESSKED